MITAAQYNFFEHKFKSPMAIKGNLLGKKQGYFLNLIDSKGNVGVGELSPLAGLSSKSLTEVKADMGHVLGQILKTPINLLQIDFKKPYFNLFDIENHDSNILFCIEGALLSLLETAHPEILKAFFKLQDFDLSVPLNGLFIDEELEKTMEGWESQGLKDIKIKIGRRSIKEDLALIWKIYRKTKGKINLRLDANQNFDLEDFSFFAKNLPLQVIDYVEDPVREIDQIDTDLKIPIALDETLQNFQHLKSPHVKAWVIKPSLAGGFSKAIELIEEGVKRDIKIVISSAFESNLSLRYLALLAHYQNTFTATACGLDTFRHFINDESRRKPYIKRGNIHF